MNPDGWKFARAHKTAWTNSICWIMMKLDNIKNRWRYCFLHLLESVIYNIVLLIKKYHDVMCAAQVINSHQMKSWKIFVPHYLIDQLPFESAISRSNHIPKMTTYLVDTCLMNLNDNFWGVIQISSTTYFHMIHFQVLKTWLSTNKK